MKKLIYLSILLSIFTGCKKSDFSQNLSTTANQTPLPKSGTFYEASILVNKNTPLGGPEADTLQTFSDACQGCTSNTFGTALFAYTFKPKMEFDSTVTYVTYYDTLICTLNNTGSKRLNVTLTSYVYDSAYDTRIGRIYATNNGFPNQVSVPVGTQTDTIPLQTGYYYHIVVTGYQDSVYNPWVNGQENNIYLASVYISGTSKCSPFSPSTITSYNYTFNWAFKFQRYYYYHMP